MEMIWKITRGIVDVITILMLYYYGDDMEEYRRHCMWEDYINAMLL